MCPNILGNLDAHIMVSKNDVTAGEGSHPLSVTYYYVMLLISCHATHAVESSRLCLYSTR